MDIDLLISFFVIVRSAGFIPNAPPGERRQLSFALRLSFVKMLRGRNGGAGGAAEDLGGVVQGADDHGGVGGGGGGGVI